MKPDGVKLKELIESEGYSPKDITEKNVMSRSTLYYYFDQKKLKRPVVEKILRALNINVEKFYSVSTSAISSFASEHDAAATYTITTHQGKNLQTYLDGKGVSVTHFASAMKVSRPTVYNWFVEKELPLGVMLESAYVLGVPVAALKGRGTGEKSFEKDIYLELKSINEKLAALQKFANAS